jgi:hypothetical protein
VKDNNVYGMMEKVNKTVVIFFNLQSPMPEWLLLMFEG